MGRQLVVGQAVTLRSSQGDITRIVVADLGQVLLVCRKEEMERAVVEDRAPAAVGFKKGDIIDC